MRHRPPLMLRTPAAALGLAALLVAAACSEPQSSQTDEEAALGPLTFDGAGEQVEGSVQFSAEADGAWQRRRGSLQVRLEPAPRLARLDVLDASGAVLESTVFQDGEGAVDLGAACGEQDCGAPVPYRITTDATEPTTLTGAVTAAFESDTTAGLGDVAVDTADLTAVPLDLDLPVHAETRVDLELSIDSAEPVAGTLVTLAPDACGQTLEVALMATPPVTLPEDEGTIQVVAPDGAEALVDEGVVEVVLACEGGDGAAARSLWLTLAGGSTEVGRSARLVLFGAATDRAEVVPGTATEGDTVSLELSPSDEAARAQLAAPEPVGGSESLLVFARLDEFEEYSADLGAGPFDDGDPAGTVRLLVGPCPPADCTAPVEASLRWFGGPPEDPSPVSASFTTYTVGA